MNALEFNSLYEEKVINKLVNEHGFVKKGNNVFLQKDNVFLALLRTSFRSLPIAYVTLCLRHSFVRDLEDNINNLFEKNPNSYPFKVSPFTISNKNLKKWHYKPNFSYHFEDNAINYGLDDSLFLGKKVEDIPYALDFLYNQVVTLGFEWMKMLTPFEALKQLDKYKEGVRTELDWIEDYKKYFK